MTRSPWPARLFGIFLAILGLYFAGMGAWLVLLGGTLYYLLAGIGMIAAGVQTIRGRGRSATSLYALVWIGTLVWAIAESGSDIWKLEVRLLAPTLLLLPFLHPWFRHGASRPRIRPAFAATGVAAGVALIGAGVWFVRPGAAGAQDAPATPGAASDWPAYGGTLAGDRYSADAQITPANVAQLKLAWVAHSDDSADAAERAHLREFHSEATPIKIADTLYTCTPHSVAMAVDATTGRIKWRYDPGLKRAGNPYLVCRGVAYYEAPGAAVCPRRIFLPMFDARIAALDADTGKPCAGFGQNGTIDLRDQAGPSPAGWQISTSPPVVANGRLVIGSRIIDNEAVDEPAGVVRAYSPDDGHLIWAWDVGRSPDAIQGPLPAGQVYTRGTPNVWGAITADVTNGLVYLPTGNATPDYYIGRRRPFDDRFGSSIVALDTATGKLRWTFQTVHRDNWDFDLPIGPTLFDMPDGTPALIQTTKTGQLFMLNRLTGKPIARVEERAVSQVGAPPGQRLSPTQPFSVGMPSLTPRKLTAQDTWGATPIDQLVCRIQFQRARNDGIFTPTGPTRAIGNPAFDGVTDWGGAAVDPVRHVMTINTMEMPFYTQLIAKDTARGARLANRGEGAGENASALQAYPQKGTPYIAGVRAWLSPFMTPCIAPPWGHLIAIDLTTQKVLWKTVLGTARDTNVFGLKYNLPLPTGTPNLGGSIVTRGGLVFIGATTDQYLRAFDRATGAEVWKARLPAGAQATPMSYTGRDGRQYVVITAGGHGAIGTRYGDATMAFALPRT